MKRFGCLPDYEDLRDLFFGAHPEALVPALPWASIENSLVVSKAQGNTNACTGCAMAQSLRLTLLKRGVECPELSDMAIYRTARNLDGEKNDLGSYLRSVIKAVQKVGAPTEAHWPHNEAKVNAQVPFGAVHSGFDASGLRHYYRVTSVDAVRRAISSGLGVVGGWQVTEAFRDWDGNGLAPNHGDKIGGHALPIVAYGTDGTFRLLNSWGTGWGQHGYAIVDEAFIDSGSDLWALDISA